MAPEDGEIASPTSEALADAEAAAEAARDRAEAARARATELRRKADEARTAEAKAAAAAEAAAVEATDAAETPLVAPEPSHVDAAPLPVSHPPSRSRWPILAAVVGVVALCGLIAASGFLVHAHRQTELNGQRSAEYSATARQGVVNLMAINFSTAEADVQRVLDSSTGEFKANFQSTSKDLIGALKEAKIVTEVSVEGVAVESMTPDSAVVLVAASTQRGNTDAQGRDPRTWRIVVTVSRDDGQLKMSKVEYV